MSTIYRHFMRKLLNETVARNIVWASARNRIFNNDNRLLNYDSTLDALFIENEFHQVFFDQSYICEFPQFILAMVKERFESGLDGSVTNEINLYLLESEQSPPYRIPFDESQITQLYESIEGNARTKSETEHNRLELIITNYLDLDPVD